jgi:hypothetical protein
MLKYGKVRTLSESRGRKSGSADAERKRGAEKVIQEIGK